MKIYKTQDVYTTQSIYRSPTRAGTIDYKNTIIGFTSTVVHYYNKTTVTRYKFI